MLKKILSFIFLLFLLVPLVSQAQGSTNYNEHIVVNFPVTNNTVSNATDYFAYLVATDKPSTSASSDTSIWMALYAGIDTSTFNNFMQVGIATDSTGYTWFVSTDPSSEVTPKVECLRGRTYAKPFILRSDTRLRVSLLARGRANSAIFA